MHINFDPACVDFVICRADYEQRNLFGQDQKFQGGGGGGGLDCGYIFKTILVLGLLFFVTNIPVKMSLVAYMAHLATGCICIRLKQGGQTDVKSQTMTHQHPSQAWK